MSKTMYTVQAPKVPSTAEQYYVGQMIDGTPVMVCQSYIHSKDGSIWYFGALEYHTSSPTLCMISELGMQTESFKPVTNPAVLKGDDYDDDSSNEKK